MKNQSIKNIIVAQRLKEGYITAIKYKDRVFMAVHGDTIHSDIIRRLSNTEFKNEDVYGHAIAGFITLKDGIFFK